MSLWLEPVVFPVLLDSCVLYPYELRDLLLEIAHEHLYRVHWSPQILDDTTRNLLSGRRRRAANTWRTLGPERPRPLRRASSARNNASRAAGVRW